MPEISRFYGITIKMYFADHAPPHFHAEYAEFEVRVGIESPAVLFVGSDKRSRGQSSFESLYEELLWAYRGGKVSVRKRN